MKWFTLFDSATGKRLNHTSVPPASTPAGVSQIEHTERKDQGGFVWNPKTQQWDSAPAAAVMIPTAEFISRFTVAEFLGVRAAARAGNARAVMVMDAFDYAKDRGTVEIDSATTAQMMGILVQESLLTAERSTEILAS